MNKLIYPAIFHKAEEGGYWVTFPDLPECMTQGDDMEQAYEMAIEALGLYVSSAEKASETLPKPSRVDQITVTDGSLVMPICYSDPGHRTDS